MPYPTSSKPPVAVLASGELQDRIRIAQIQQSAQIASQLQEAILQKDYGQVLGLANRIASPELDNLQRDASPEELGIRRIMHEIVDEGLRTLLLASGTQTDHWKRVFMPDQYKLFEFPKLLTNALWLRIAGSEIPDNNEERLDPSALAGMGFKDQALTVARFCCCNDGRSRIDYPAVAKVLDARILPSFNNWILTVYSFSPDRLAEEQSTANQTRAIRDFLQASKLPHESLPATAAQATTAFTSPYWSDDSQRPIAEAINGKQMRGLFERFIPDPQEEGPEWPELDILEDTDSIVICPNWFDEHVIHRCMSPLTEGMRKSGAQAIRIYRSLLQGHTRQVSDWGQQSLDVFHGEEYVLSDISRICRRLRELDIDFAFHPEIVPVNSSAWTATERIARVQATGYGFPVTSGLRAMDYYIGGAAVEIPGTDGADYTERLVLLPGLGVSTTPPPLPKTARTRPTDDERVHLCATSSKKKLGTELLSAWDAIQQGEDNTYLSLFTNMSEQEAASYSGPMAQLLTHGEVDLNCTVDRVDLVQVISDADLYLDSFPFGGFNTLVEALVCGVPVLTLQGTQARNRFGAAIIRQLELPEFLIANSYSEYISTAKRLIGDAGLRQEIRSQLGEPAQVLAKLADPHMADHFDAAVKWMKQQGPRRGRPMAPVYIEAGEKPRILSA
jgi:hypothetical protein